MRKRIIIPTLVVLVALFSTLGAPLASADRTEHLGMRVLPTPGDVIVDGKIDDWDLSGGVFGCNSIRRSRESYACWFHLMYDADNLYILVRWSDLTPMNNPMSAPNPEGFWGDSLQVRFMLSPGTMQERTTHVTAWMSAKDKADVINISYGRKFNEGKIADAQDHGARQEFLKNKDGKGYSQEIALPWKLLVAKDADPPKAGEKFVMTVQPNFSVGHKRIVRIVDILKPNAPRAGTWIFEAHERWGGALLEPKGNVKPWPVRLSDGRMFAVRMKNGAPVADWNTLVTGEKDATIVWPPSIARVRQLTVASEPIMGVKIIGTFSGSTNYMAVCVLGRTEALLAPPQVVVDGDPYDFLRWKVDDVERPDDFLRVEIKMEENHTATAVYEIRQHRLTVQSAPIMGVMIAGDPRGVTDYSVLCNSQRQVELRAPDSVEVDGEQYSFVRWIVNEKEKPDGNEWIQITMDADCTAMAVYAARGGQDLGQEPASDETAEPAIRGPGNAPQVVAVRSRWRLFIAGGLVLVVVLALVVWLVSMGDRRY